MSEGELAPDCQLYHILQGVLQNIMPLGQYKKYGVGELMIDSQWAVEMTFVIFIKCQTTPTHFVSV